MKEKKYKLLVLIRKCLFLSLFIISTVLIVNITPSMMETVGFDSITGVSLATDKRTAYFLWAVFGMIGYVVEVVLERIKNN